MCKLSDESTGEKLFKGLEVIYKGEVCECRSAILLECGLELEVFLSLIVLGMLEVSDGGNGSICEHSSA